MSEQENASGRKLPCISLLAESDYDSGYLNDYGGGNVGWWQDYIRAEVGRCNDYWRSQIAQLEQWWRVEKTKPGAADKRAIVDAPCLAEFRVGDIVEATATIRRKDGRSELRPGDEATVRAVSKTNPDSPQIIDLDIEGGLPMGDIVCFAHVPLRLLHSPYASAHPRAAKGGDK
jgi:hypothetical protein